MARPSFDSGQVSSENWRADHANAGASMQGEADWEDICNEKAQKGRDAAKRSGELCMHILLANLNLFGR